VKIGKIQPKCTKDDGGTVKTGFTNKSAGFLENQRGNFWAVFAENRPIFVEIYKWNEKTVKNNDMTSTKFIHINNP
jgi:hypothetical protein